MPTNKPDPAAVKAARKCVDIHYFNGASLAPDERFCATCGNYLTDDAHLRDDENRCDRAAAIIDSTTHVGELRDVLTDLAQSYRVQAGKHASRQSKVLRRAESVLAKLPKE